MSNSRTSNFIRQQNTTLGSESKVLISTRYIISLFKSIDYFISFKHTLNCIIHNFVKLENSNTGMFYINNVYIHTYWTYVRYVL